MPPFIAVRRSGMGRGERRVMRWSTLISRMKVGFRYGGDCRRVSWGGSDKGTLPFNLMGFEDFERTSWTLCHHTDMPHFFFLFFFPPLFFFPSLSNLLEAK